LLQEEFTGSTVISGTALPEDLRPSSRIVRVCPIDGNNAVCRAFVASDGLIYIGWIGSYDDGSISITRNILWSDIIIDWYI